MAAWRRQGQEDLNLVNAGGQNVTLRPGAAVVHHADSFGVIRGGQIDATVMGAYQVSMTGDFANWKLKGQKGGGIGGAMDLAACAKRVFIILEHVTRDGAPRLVTACDLPVTARGVVTLVATNYGLFEPAGSGFLLREIAAGADGGRNPRGDRGDTERCGWVAGGEAGELTDCSQADAIARETTAPAFPSEVKALSPGEFWSALNEGNRCNGVRYEGGDPRAGGSCGLAEAERDGLSRHGHRRRGARSARRTL